MAMVHQQFGYAMAGGTPPSVGTLAERRRAGDPSARTKRAAAYDRKHADGE